MLETARIGGDAGPLQECSSIGRAPVSKTGGRRFEPCHSCHLLPILFTIFSATLLFGATIFVPSLVQIDQPHGLAGHPLAVRRPGVDFGLADGRPVEHRHQLRGGGAVFRRQGGAGLFQAMGGTLG